MPHGGSEGVDSPDSRQPIEQWRQPPNTLQDALAVPLPFAMHLGKALLVAGDIGLELHAG
jgi:hypothetical protein